MSIEREPAQDISSELSAGLVADFRELANAWLTASELLDRSGSSEAAKATLACAEQLIERLESYSCASYRDNGERYDAAPEARELCSR